MYLLRNILGYGLTLPVRERAGHLTSRRKRLAAIIRHANTHCPYYKGYYDPFVECEKDLTDEEFYYAFSHLPIIERRHLESDNGAFCSDEMNGLETLFSNGERPSFWTLLKHGLFKKDFSASLTLNTSSIKRWINRHDATIYVGSILRALMKNGWKRGQAFVAFLPKGAYFTNNLAGINSILYHFFGLTVIPFEDITTHTVEALLSSLRNTGAKTLVTTPHALQRIAHIMHEQGFSPYEKLKCINVSGAYFLDCNKTFVQTMFPESDIQCSYGAAECGMLAHQSSMSSYDYDVLDDYVYLEQGPGNSILVTTYNQTAFPLIRYKIEDMGRVISYKDGTQKIKSLEGSNTGYLIGADGYMYFPSFFNIFINELNKALNDPVMDFVLRYKNDKSGAPHHLDLSFVLSNPAKQDKIRKTALEVLKPVFANYKHITVSFPHHIEHDFTAKYKIINSKSAMPEKLGSYQKFRQIQPLTAKEQNTARRSARHAISLDKVLKKKAS